MEIQDSAGGLPKNLKYPFAFAATTSKPLAHGSVYAMSGHGYGLPLSKLYCRFMQGDLKLIRIPGGTIARITFKGDWKPESVVI